MACDGFEDKLMLYIYGKLNVKDRESIDRHLKECPDCANLLKEFAQTGELLKNLKPIKLPDGFKQELRLKLDVAREVSRQNKFSFFAARVYAPALAAVLIVICATVIVNKSNNIRTFDPKQNLVQNPPVNNVIPAKTGQSINQPAQKNLTETIEIARSTPEQQKPVIFRGTGADYRKKKIIQQWQDIYSGIKTKESIIIEDQQKWKDLWEKHNPKVPVPEINFKENMVIAVFMGEQKTSGYGIQISQIEDSGSKIYIDLEETVPASEENITGKPTQPYHIVVVSKQ
jgi:hypothetical protein